MRECTHPERRSQLVTEKRGMRTPEPLSGNTDVRFPLYLTMTRQTGWRLVGTLLAGLLTAAGLDLACPLPPATLDFRLVCAGTGFVPGEHCPNQLIDYYLPGTSSARRCEHQQEALVSADDAIT